MAIKKMSQFGHLIVFFVLCYAHFGHGQDDTSLESSHNYNFPQLIVDIGSRVSLAQDLKHASGDPDFLMILDRLKNLIPKLPKDLLNALKRMDNNSKCSHDIKYLSNNLEDKDMWGIKMLDAFGKPGSGILEGNFKWIGNYHECVNVHVPLNESVTAGNFDGQYCSVDFMVALFNKKIPLTLGICLPDSCESELVKYKGMMSLLNTTKSVVNITKLTIQPTSKKLSSAAIGMIFLISVFVTLAVIGSGMTAYEYFYETNTTQNEHRVDDVKTDAPINGELQKQENDGSSALGMLPNRNLTSGLYARLKPFFNCFCVFTNGEKLLNTDSTEGQLLCLHGIRFLSMSWVIVGHVYAISLPTIGNLLEAMTLIDGFLFQILLNGSFSVDSFFLLSGFLVAYLFFQQFSKSDGKFPWVYFYVHRYIRLTPVYMIALGIHTTLFYYMGSGPFWTTNAVEPVCHKNWWYNVFYINNFLSLETQCFGWAWYLANDMQFFIISPLFLITLWRWPKIGYSIIGIFLSVCFAVNFGLTFHFDLFGGVGNMSDLVNDFASYTKRYNEFFDKVYGKPYTRISPYIIGIALAYYMFRRKQNKKGKVNLITLCCGWIVASAVALTCIFCQYNRTTTTVENSFSNALRRTCYAGALSWLIFACLNGQGGPVNSILCFKPFIFLSRLTYSAYLIHPVIIYGYFGALKSTLYFSHMTMVTTFLGLLVQIYAASFVISVLFESPIIRLEKIVKTKFRA